MQTTGRGSVPGFRAPAIAGSGPAPLPVYSVRSARPRWARSTAGVGRAAYFRVGASRRRSARRPRPLRSRRDTPREASARDRYRGSVWSRTGDAASLPACRKSGSRRSAAREYDRRPPQIAIWRQAGAMSKPSRPATVSMATRRASRACRSLSASAAGPRSAVATAGATRSRQAAAGRARASRWS